MGLFGFGKKSDAPQTVEERAEAIYKKGKNAFSARKLGKALDCFKEAGELGHVGAQYNAGVLGSQPIGIGVGPNMAEALRWYTLAAKGGHAKAAFNLGVIYYTGDGVRRDLKEALRWAKLAAERGHGKAPDLVKQLERELRK